MPCPSTHSRQTLQYRTSAQCIVNGAKRRTLSTTRLVRGSSEAHYQQQTAPGGSRCARRSSPSTACSSNSSVETVSTVSTVNQKPVRRRLSTDINQSPPQWLQANGLVQWLVGLWSAFTEFSMSVAPAPASLTVSCLSELLGIRVGPAKHLYDAEKRLHGAYPLSLRRNWDALCDAFGSYRWLLKEMVMNQPAVLLLSPKQQDVILAAAARTLYLSPSQLPPLLLQCPQLLLISPSTLADRANTLKQVMMVSRKQLQATIRQDPELLLVDTASMHMHANAFSRLLGSPTVAATVLRKCPSLLCVSLQRIAKRLQVLMELFGELPQIVDLVVVWPPLLAVNGQAIRGRVRSAETFLGPGRRGLFFRAPQLLSLRAERLRQNHQGLTALFGLKTAASMVARTPGVLVLTPQALKTRLDALALQLGRPYHDVVSVVGYYPSLLLRGTEAMKEKLYRLVMLFGITYEAAVKMAASCPGLLRRPAEELAAKWLRLHAVVKSSYRWERQLRHMKLSVLARMLMQDALEYDRLQYVQAMKQQNSITMQQALLMPLNSFCLRFPSFPAWRREQQLGRLGRPTAQLVSLFGRFMLYPIVLARTPSCPLMPLLPENCESLLAQQAPMGLDGP